METQIMKTVISVAILLFVASLPTGITAQTTAFSFQGRLNDGTNHANGHYDLQFKLFDAITAGSQVGSTIDKPDTVLINGVFSTQLDFGSASFGGGNRFMEISLRPFNSPNAYVVLGARQQIMAVPYAIRAVNASNADNAISATNATQATSAQFATSAQNSKSLGGVAASGYARLNVGNTGNLVADNLGSAGILQLQGNAMQPEASNGLPKAMVAITAGGIIARCYNGVTGTTTANCGITVTDHPIPGVFNITFPFQVSNRFWLITNDGSGPFGDLSAVVTPLSSNELEAALRRNGSFADLPFHLFVF